VCSARLNQNLVVNAIFIVGFGDYGFVGAQSTR